MDPITIAVIVVVLVVGYVLTPKTLKDAVKKRLRGEAASAASALDAPIKNLQAVIEDLEGNHATISENKDELDPKTCGLIAECGLKRGLLLPDLEEVDTVEQQVSICCQKAGIEPGEPVKLYTFKVKRYK